MPKSSRPAGVLAGLAGDALYQQVALLSEMMENTREVFWLADWVGQRILYISPAYEKIWGRPARALLGRYDEWVDSLHPGDAADAQAALDRIAWEGNGEDIEYRIVRPDGQVRWISDRVFPVRDDEGRVVHLAGIAEDITERKQGEQALRDSEATWRSLVTNAPNIIFTIDAQGAIAFMNRTASGADPETVVGTCLYDYVAPEHRHAVCDQIARVFTTAESCQIACLTSGPFGHETWCALHAGAIRGDGTVAAAIVIARNTTEQRRAREELQRRARFQELVTAISSDFVGRPANAVDDGIHRALQAIGEFAGGDRTAVFSFSEDGERLSCTHEWCAEGIESSSHRIQDVPVGSFPWVTAIYEKRQVVYFPRVDDLPPDATALKRELQSKGVRSVLSVPMECGGRVVGFVAFHAVRSERAWPEDLTPLLRIVGEVFASALERKRAEGKLRLLSSVVAQSTEGTVVADTTGRILFVNEAAADLIGRRPDDLIGQHISEFHSPDLVPQVLTDFEHACTNGEYQAEVTCERHDGSSFPVAMTGFLLRNDAGEATALIVLLRDVTEQKRSEQERRRTERLESLGLLAGGIAHDFNNMLAGVMGNLSLAGLNGNTDPDVLECIDGAEKAVMRARGLTSQLLAFAKGGAPVRSAASIAELLRDTAAFVLAGSSVNPRFHVANDLWPAKVDADQISQVIQNLILNAKEAMPDGGSIDITAANIVVGLGELAPLAPGRYVKVSVHDGGGGIRSEHLSNIFDPYFTTKAGGSGLGLAISHSIIAKHEGLIRIDSQPGKGTTVEFLLPAGGAIPKPHPRKPTRTANTGRVLLMDDDPIVRRTAVALLQRSGYDVTCAADGAQAVELYGQAADDGHPFDAVVLDLTVPGGMGGKQCLQELLRLNPRVQAIASSGYSDDATAADFAQLGFCASVPKPYPLEQLLNTLNEAIRNANDS